MPKITIELTVTQLVNLINVEYSGLNDLERLASSTVDIKIVVVDER